MTYAKFNTLLVILRPYLFKQNTKYRKATGLEEHASTWRKSVWRHRHCRSWLPPREISSVAEGRAIRPLRMSGRTCIRFYGKNFKIPFDAIRPVRAMRTSGRLPLGRTTDVVNKIYKWLITWKIFGMQFFFFSTSINIHIYIWK